MAVRLQKVGAGEIMLLNWECLAICAAPVCALSSSHSACTGRGRGPSRFRGLLGSKGTQMPGQLVCCGAYHDAWYILLKWIMKGPVLPLIAKYSRTFHYEQALNVQFWALITWYAICHSPNLILWAKSAPKCFMMNSIYNWSQIIFNYFFLSYFWEVSSAFFFSMEIHY